MVNAPGRLKGVRSRFKKRLLTPLCAINALFAIADRATGWEQ
jgi:hypothetical protein